MNELSVFGLIQIERDVLLQQLTAALRVDERVVAAWLSGSMGRGTAAALSYLDLRIAVRDDALSGICADPRQFVASIRSPMLVIDAPVNAPPGGAYLFTLFASGTGPHEVDWYWRPASTAVRPDASRLLFDHAGIPLAGPPPAFTDEHARERLLLLLDTFIAVAAIAGKLIARGWPLPATGNLRTTHQLLIEVEWIIAHNTQPEYDDIKERVRDIPVPASSTAALADLLLLLHAAESLCEHLTERGVAWPDASLAQVQRFLLRISQP